MSVTDAPQANIVNDSTTEEVASGVMRLAELVGSEIEIGDENARELHCLFECVQVALEKIGTDLPEKQFAARLCIEQERVSADHLTLESAFSRRKHVDETKLVLADSVRTGDETLFRNIALAHRNFGMIRSGQTYAEIVEAEGASKRRSNNLLELAFLAPDVIRNVFEGRQPTGLKSDWLDSYPFPSI